MGGCLSNCCGDQDETKLIQHEVDQFIKQIRPLDLLVFRGGDFVSDLIADLQGDQIGHYDITHVEIVINKELCPGIGGSAKDDPSETLYSWGSTMSGKLNDGVNNAETDQAFFGVQIRDLRQLVKEYAQSSKSANIGVCHLLENPLDQREGEDVSQHQVRVEKVKEIMARLFEEHNGKKYNANPLALLSSIYPSLVDDNEAFKQLILSGGKQNEWLFCSELVAIVYQGLGIIDDQIKPSSVSPVELVHQGFFDDVTEVFCAPPKWFRKHSEIKSILSDEAKLEFTSQVVESCSSSSDSSSSDSSSLSYDQEEKGKCLKAFPNKGISNDPSEDESDEVGVFTDSTSTFSGIEIKSIDTTDTYLTIG